MFEAAEVGHTVSKAAWAREVDTLWPRLLDAQRALVAAKRAAVVVIAGVELAGKSELINQLNEWLDARGVRTVAFWDESDEERERPRHWRFWRELPGAGQIGILLGSWYTAPI